MLGVGAEGEAGARIEQQRQIDAEAGRSDIGVAAEQRGAEIAVQGEPRVVDADRSEIEIGAELQLDHAGIQLGLLGIERTIAGEIEDEAITLAFEIDRVVQPPGDIAVPVLVAERTLVELELKAAQLDEGRTRTGIGVGLVADADTELAEGIRPLGRASMVAM